MQPHETALHEAIRAELAQLERLSLSYAMEQVPNATARANEIMGSVLVLRAALARAAAAAERAVPQAPKMPTPQTLQRSVALAPRKVVPAASADASVDATSVRVPLHNAAGEPITVDGGPGPGVEGPKADAPADAPSVRDAQEGGREVTYVIPGLGLVSLLAEEEEEWTQRPDSP